MQAMNATFARQVQQELFKLRAESAGFSEETSAHTSNKKMLVDDLRRKLLSGELRLKDIIDNQESMTEFKISLPPDLPMDDDSDNEDMRVRRRDVTLKRGVDSAMRTAVPDSEGPLAAPSGAAAEPTENKARSSADIGVDLEETDEEDKDDETSDDFVPDLITLDMIVALWRQTTAKIQTGIILSLDQFGLLGGDILAYCLGLGAPDGVDTLLSYSALYKMGLRALGRGATSQRRLVYSEQVFAEVRALKDKMLDAQQECADPDADGARPLQVREEDWSKLTAAEQAAKLSSNVRQLARKGLLDPQSWCCIHPSKRRLVDSFCHLKTTKNYSN
jgi:hypothetical protein